MLQLPSNSYNSYANDPYMINCHNNVGSLNNIQELETEIVGLSIMVICNHTEFVNFNILMMLVILVMIKIMCMRMMIIFAMILVYNDCDHVYNMTIMFLMIQVMKIIMSVIIMQFL